MQVRGLIESGRTYLLGLLGCDNGSHLELGGLGNNAKFKALIFKWAYCTITINVAFWLFLAIKKWLNNICHLYNFLHKGVAFVG
jgi:hypothetical protein